MHPFADHFSTIARAYAAARPSYPDALFAYLASLAPAGRRAWDCAAGNGQATRHLALHFAEVVGTDASAAQIAEAPAQPGIVYRVAPAEASGIDSASVDLITVAQALHWLDLPAFYREARRVLVSAGVLAVWCYGLQRVDDAGIDRLLQRFYGETVGPYWPPERRLVEEGYRTVPFPFDELPARSFEMAHDWALDELLAYLRTWSATNRFIAGRGYDPVPPLAADLAPLWGSAEASRRVRWPLSLRVGRSLGPE